MDKPLEHLLQGFLGLPWRCQIGLHVIQCAMQDVNLVLQCIKFVSGHHQFIFRQSKFRCALTRYPVPLTTPLTAEFLRSTRTGRNREYVSAPSAAFVYSLLPRCTAIYRHDEIIRQVALTMCHSLQHLHDSLLVTTSVALTRGI